MTSRTLVFLVLLLSSSACLGQASGSIAYAQGGAAARAAQNERGKRILTPEDMPPNRTSTLLEASVLMNTKADEYVAVFGAMQEGTTIADCQEKMDQTVRAFTTALGALGVAGRDVFVDFVAQNRIYGYEVSEQIAREKLTGFELKKNVIVHYRDYAVLDKLVAAAAQCGIYDLIKVDYVLKDVPAVQRRLMEEASRILKLKAANCERLLGLRLGPPVQVYAARSSIYYPSDLYDSYVAAEAEAISAGFDRQRYVIQGARKSRTFVFNALSASGFDSVLGPIVTEPVVQCTLYLKARYEPARAPSRASSGAAGRRR